MHERISDELSCDRGKLKRPLWIRCRMNKNIKYGVILSYILLLTNTAYGLLMTPYILGYVGESSYGVYKTVASLSSSFSVMDLGLGATMTRYMAKFAAKGEKTKAKNFFAMILIQFSIIAGAILSVGFIIYISTNKVFGETFSSAELLLAKRLVLLLFLNMVLRLLENLMTGVLSGYEQFLLSNTVKLSAVIMKFMLIFVFLPFTNDVTLIVSLDCLLSVVSILIEIFYIIVKIKVVPKLIKWDMALFRESFGYTALMFIQTITIQFNGNIDNVLIGSILGASSVTVYSMALTIFNMYESLSGSIANVMLPNMAKKVENGVSAAQIQRGVENAGRMQFILLAAALGGFTVLGKDFYGLWLGAGFEDCYYLTLLLIIPVTFPMIQNVALSVLRAQNKMLYRTVTLVVSCALNAIATVVGIYFLGYWGAALGTAISTISNLLFMNYYYHTHLYFHIFKLFKNIFRGILPCAVVASIVTALVHKGFTTSWVSFAINAGVFVAIYGAGLLTYGLDKTEKKILLGRFVCS